jgi:hypothetical protein
MIDNQTLATVVVALVAAVPPTLVAFAALRSSRLNSAKADQLIDKTTEIKTQTDGQLTKVMGSLNVANEKLNVANEKIAGLEKLIAEKNKTAEPPPTLPAKRNK